MKTVLAAILIYFTLFGCKTSRTSEVTTTNDVPVDSLILRQICDYCQGENSYYYPHKFAENTRCICYYEWDSSKMAQSRTAMLEVAHSVKHLTIENPSLYIYEIPFEKFKSLHTLLIFGNDYNTDGLKYFPAELLQLKTLQKIIFEGVKFDKKELARIKKEYPKIEIVGEIEDYQIPWR